MVVLAVLLGGGCSTLAMRAELGVALGCEATIFDSTGGPGGSVRTTVVISDLHLGVGQNARGTGWHPFEDFRWAAEFAEFLACVDQRGKGATDLVLNGDTFELWQSLWNDCQYEDPDLGCTEDEALRRIQRVIAQHGIELAELGKFASRARNRLIIVPGNHDAALLFPRIRGEVIKAIGASPGRVEFRTEGYWLSSDGQIYAEHGHQIGQEVNKWNDWPSPFREIVDQERRVVHLVRPWGERFVQTVYNRYEEKYPIIDNISEESVGVDYALAAEGGAGAIGGLGRFLKFFFTQVSWEQFKAALGGKEEALEWDVQAVRDQGDAFLLEMLPEGGGLRRAAGEALSTRSLGISLANLSLQEIVAVCDKRAVLRAAELAAAPDREPPLKECPTTTGERLGAVSQYLFRSRDRLFKEHLTITRDRLAGLGGNRPFTVFVYSHTHLANAFRPFERDIVDWDPLVLNTGAWQRTMSAGRLREIIKEKGFEDQATALRALQPEDLDPCYTAVVVPPYTDHPSPGLLVWRRGTWGWEWASTCREERPAR